MKKSLLLSKCSIIWIVSVMSLLNSCNGKAKKVDSSTSGHSETVPSIESNNTDISSTGCDVSLLRARRQYTGDKRGETVYLLWNIYRIQLLQLEERAGKLGSTIIQKINSGHRDSVINEIGNYLHDLTKNKNALLQKPKLEELQKLSELIYCNYSHSIKTFSELKEIVSAKNPNGAIVANVLKFFDDPTKDDFQTMQKIGEELRVIDKKYGISQKQISE